MLEAAAPIRRTPLVDSRIAIRGQAGDQHGDRAPAATQGECRGIVFRPHFRREIGYLGADLYVGNARTLTAIASDFALRYACSIGLTVGQPEGLELDHISLVQP